MTDKRFVGGNWEVSIRGLDLIFAILCLICKIMIYRLPVRDSIEHSRVRDFKKELNVIIGD